MKYKLILLLLICTTLLGAKELEKVSLQLFWLDQFEFAGYYIAKERGFYEDVGLDVEIKKFNYDMVVVDEVTNTEATYGIANSELVVDCSNGANIQLLSAIFQASPLVVLSAKDSNISTIKDFMGKTIMMADDITKTMPLQVMMSSRGIGIDDLTVIPHSFNVDDLISKKTDLMVAYLSNEPFLLKEKKIPYKVFDPKDSGFDFYADILFTSENEAINHKQRALNFKNASLKGWQYAFEHIDETIELILKKYNTQNRSKKALLHEATALKKLFYYKQEKAGDLNKGRLQRIYDIYNIMGFIENKIDIERFIFNAEEKPSINFTKKEKAWLKTHPTITYSEVNWKPLSIIENGEMTGIMGDYLKIVAHKTGINFQFMPANSWGEVLEKFKKQEIDMIPGISSSSQEKKLGLLSDSYTNFKMVIVTDEKFKYVDSLKNLSDKTIAVPKYYTSYNFIKEYYPDQKLIVTEDIKEALTLVHKGKADAFIGHIATSLYYMSNLHLANLKISGQTTFNFDHRYLIQKESPEFISIVNKVLKTVTQNEKDDIYAQWVHTVVDKKVDYTLIWQLTSAFIFILGVGLFFSIKQNQHKKEIEKLNDSLEVRVKEEIEKNKKKEEQLFTQSRLAQMGEMISMIAHQWRQPLGAISSTAVNLKIKIELENFDLETQESKNECNNYFLDKLNDIEKFSQNLTTTIDDFRNFYKSNKATVYVNFKEISTKALGIIETSLINDGIDIHYNYQSGEKIEMHDSEMMQVILNILKNTQDNFRERQTQNPKISITTYNKSIKICDNGGGIPQDVIEKIFDPYFSTKTEKHGTGLGLYMSKTIVEDHHNGTLHVNNQDGGACFTIDLNNKE